MEMLSHRRCSVSEASFCHAIYFLCCRPCQRRQWFHEGHTSFPDSQNIILLCAAIISHAPFIVECCWIFVRIEKLLAFPRQFRFHFFSFPGRTEIFHFKKRLKEKHWSCTNALIKQLSVFILHCSILPTLCDCNMIVVIVKLLIL